MSDNSQQSSQSASSQPSEPSESSPPSQLAPTQSSTPAGRGRYDPFSMFSEMENMMDRMFGGRWPFLTSRQMRRLPQGAGGWTPHVDMYEQGNDIVVKAELPGISKDNIDVQIEDGDLVIKGERQSENESTEENYYRMERSFGSFYRRLPLPEGVQHDQVQATFKDGVLDVRIPKPAAGEQSARKIEVR